MGKQCFETKMKKEQNKAKRKKLITMRTKERILVRIEAKEPLECQPPNEFPELVLKFQCRMKTDLSSSTSFTSATPEIDANRNFIA